MSRRTHFNLPARVLHWLMAAMILTMLFVGVGMVASVTQRPWLIDLHRPLGIAILILAVLRLINRLRHRPPPLPADLPAWQSGCRDCLALAAVCIDAGHAVDRLGDAVGRRLPDRAVARREPAGDRTARSCTVCLAAQRAWLAGVSVICHRAGASERGVVSRLDTPRRGVFQHGAWRAVCAVMGSRLMVG